MSDNKSTLESKKSDPVATSLRRFLDYVVKNSKTLSILAGLLILVSLSVIGGQAFLRSQSDSLGEELVAIETAYNDEIKAHTSRLEKLEAELDELKLQKEKQKGDESKEQASQIDEKISKLEAEVKNLSPDHEKSQAEFKSFYDKYPDEAQGWVAGIRYAATEIEQGNLDSAKKVLSKIVEASNSYKLIHLQSSLLMVRVLEDQNSFDDAMKYVSALQSKAPDALKPTLLLAQGRLHLMSGNKSEAQKAFDELNENFADSPEASKGMAFKALLF